MNILEYDEELDQLTQPANEEVMQEDPILGDLALLEELTAPKEPVKVDPMQLIEKLTAPKEPVKVDPMQLIEKLQAELEALKKAPKNQTAGVPGNRSYIRLGPLTTDGKVPQQQADLARVLAEKMPVGETFTEAQVFGFLEAARPDFPSLNNSRQDVTYLFRYYRGLKPSDKHAGFVARGFLRQV